MYSMQLKYIFEGTQRPVDSDNKLMRKTQYRHFIVALWLMIFLGQALASASLCCENPALSSQLEQQKFDANNFVDTSNGPLVSNEPLLNQPSLIESSSVKALAIDHRQHQQPKSSLSLKPVLDADATPECISDCDCLMGGCAAAALSKTQPGFNINFILPTSAYTSLPQDHLITSLFRPPISR